MSQCEGELFNLFVSQFCGEECDENDYRTAACHTLITDGVCARIYASVCICVSECMCVSFVHTSTFPL